MATAAFVRPRLTVRVPRGRTARLGVVAVVTVALYLGFRGVGAWPTAWVTGFQNALDSLSTWVSNNNTTSPVFVYGFNTIGSVLASLVNGVYSALSALTWIGLTALGGLVALRWANVRVALLVTASFVVYGVLGLWQLSLVTLALIITSVAFALLVGVPLGILAGLSARFDRLVTPLLDVMQVLPAFAYLMPVVLLFGIGASAAVVVTVIFAIPPAVRITALGIRGVASGPVEAARSLGTTRRQLLWKVQLPLARETLLVGINQVIMLALSMVVIASLIAAGGLGDPVLAALTVVKVGNALVPGVAIVMIAISLDRLTMALATGSGRSGRGRRRVLLNRLGSRQVTLIGLAVLATIVVLARLAGVGFWPSGATTSFADPVNSWATSLQASLNLQSISNVFIIYLLDPLQNVFEASPWWLVIAASAAAGWVLGRTRTALTVVSAWLVIGLVGVWQDSMDTLSQVLAATLITVVIGVAAGIATSRTQWLERLLRPVLDTMQTMPSFVYLVPVIGLFGVGRTPAAIAAIIYALPVVIRLTDSGLRQVSPTIKEAAVASGTSPWQLLVKVELPMARPSLALAANQGLMYVLAMVIVGSLVGGGALGYDVLVGLSQNRFGLGMAAGVAIVGLGVVLDRITQAAAGDGRRAPL